MNQMSDRREGPVSSPESPVQVLVIPTDEEAAIAADTYLMAVGRAIPRRNGSTDVCA
jgi:acetate kinase